MFHNTFVVQTGKGEKEKALFLRQRVCRYQEQAPVQGLPQESQGGHHCVQVRNTYFSQ